jgi:ABC-type multidrug transport system ATPase subunit
VPAPAIEIRGLRVERGKRLVLPAIDLDIQAGRITGLIGPSGGGKSTLIRAIVGVQVVAGGVVTVLGEPAGSASLRPRVAYVTQSGSVYRDLTVAENVTYSARILGAGREDVARAIATVDLADTAGRRVGSLSGGQQHRVSLACALLGTPELIVLDEPTVGLDPLLRRDLWALFARLRDEGRTLLVSTHVLDEANNCDAVVLLRDGRVLAAETPDALRREAGTDDLDAAFLRLIERGDDAR